MDSMMTYSYSDETAQNTQAYKSHVFVLIVSSSLSSSHYPYIKIREWKKKVGSGAVISCWTTNAKFGFLHLFEMKLLMESTENSEKSEPQMGFEPTTLRDLFGCSNHWATGDSVASEMWVFDSSCITQLKSEITTDSIAHNCLTQSPF